MHGGALGQWRCFPHGAWFDRQCQSYAAIPQHKQKESKVPHGPAIWLAVEELNYHHTEAVSFPIYPLYGKPQSQTLKPQYCGNFLDRIPNGGLSKSWSLKGTILLTIPQMLLCKQRSSEHFASELQECRGAAHDTGPAAGARV